jgi:uncharacterized protein YdaU (DUF1376 family)
MNHYPHHIGDFNNATRHLTRVERSLYRDLIDLYYHTEQALNSDMEKLARRVLVRSQEEREALDLVIEEFFVLRDDGWHTRTWTARRGYALSDEAVANSASETLWCSPHCVPLVEYGNLDLFLDHPH